MENQAKLTRMELLDEARRLRQRVREMRVGLPGTGASSRNERRSLIREWKLNIAAPHRRCRTCGRVYSLSSRWIVKRVPGRWEEPGDRYVAMCRPCYSRHLKLERRLNLPLSEPVFHSPRVVYDVSPVLLREAREASGLSMRQFASHMGWTRSYQYKLEAGVQRTVSSETRDLMLRLLKHFGASTCDVRWELTEGKEVSGSEWSPAPSFEEAELPPAEDSPES